MGFPQSASKYQIYFFLNFKTELSRESGANGDKENLKIFGVLFQEDKIYPGHVQEELLII